MATLQDIVNDNKTLTRSQLKADQGLVREIQTKLANLGLYPGGQWIDGDLGTGGHDGTVFDVAGLVVSFPLVEFLQ